MVPLASSVALTSAVWSDVRNERVCTFSTDSVSVSETTVTLSPSSRPEASAIDT